MEVKAFVTIDKEKEIAPGVWVRLERTHDPNRFHIHLADMPNREPTTLVKHHKIPPHPPHN